MSDLACLMRTNRNVKVFIGAPASSTAAGSGYVDISTLQTIAQATRKDFPSFGGVMFWDASQSYANGRYDQATKTFLKSGGSCGKAFTYQVGRAAARESMNDFDGPSPIVVLHSTGLQLDGQLPRRINRS